MKMMDNDSLLIISELYQAGMVDSYQLHQRTRIPPTSLYLTLEDERMCGRATRDGLCYYLTKSGEAWWRERLRSLLLRPSTEFKTVPGKFLGQRLDLSDTSAINDIVQ